MGAFLSNLRYVSWTALAVGLVFLVYVAAALANQPPPSQFFYEALLRWTHVLSGIMWIGHLYYFNFTQIPNAPKIPAEHRGPAIAKVIAPAALFWFRWGAMATLFTGLLLAWNQGYIVDALLLGATTEFAVPKNIFIGVGMWLAIIMWFNVWFIIWPNQQKALGIGEANAALEQAVKDKSARTAMLFSRTNTFLSVPMLVAMTGASTLF
ncbi:MAG: urate hydroxylase PuuD [Hyphomonadaceae bacterium]